MDGMIMGDVATLTLADGGTVRVDMPPYSVAPDQAPTLVTWSGRLFERTSPGFVFGGPPPPLAYQEFSPVVVQTVKP